MIKTPIREKGIRFCGTFYAIPYKCQISKYNEIDYIYCKFILLYTDPVTNELEIFDAYTTWDYKEIAKSYGTVDKTDTLLAHKKHIPKNEAIYVEGVLRSTYPEGFTPKNAEEAKSWINDYRRTNNNMLDGVFNNMLYICSYSKNSGVNEIINQQVITQMNDINSVISAYLQLIKEKEKEYSALNENMFSEGQIANKDIGVTVKKITNTQLHNEKPIVSYVEEKVIDDKAKGGEDIII